jgi:anaerobic dimethyl sulfoxide reductase subunit C (anchor subunit)
MNAREWALIIFTIIGQMSVGAFVVLGIAHFLAARKCGVDEADKLSDRALLAIGPVLVLGIVASLFHLGNPLNAPRAITNLGSSPLSWEILLGTAFAIIGGVFAIMQWRKFGTAVLRNVVALLAAVIGVLFVYAMSRVYMLPSVPAWNTPATPVTFFTTTFLLGALAIGAAFVANYTFLRRRNGGEDSVQLMLMRDALRWIALASVVMLGIHFIVIPLYLAYLANGPAAAIASASLLAGKDGVLLGIWLVFIFLGAGVFSLFVYQNASSVGQVRVMSTLAYLAFILVLVGEVVGRYLFYASFYRIGL